MLARIYAEKSRQKRLVEKKGTEHANATLQSENAQLKRQLAALTRSPGIEIELNGSLFLCYQIGKVPAVPAAGAAGARSSTTPPPGGGGHQLQKVYQAPQADVGGRGEATT